MRTDPIDRFSEIFERARQACTPPHDPTAMSLATSTCAGVPSVRVVLLKSFDRHGFVFYSNRLSRKGRELAENPVAALCMHWAAIGEQVRVSGTVVLVDDAESDTYFVSRPLQSRLGAWASEQSQPLSSRESLMARVATLAAKFALGGVPRPPHWGGYRIVPTEIEFWSDGAFRLHNRFLYTLTGSEWTMQRLSP